MSTQREQLTSPQLCLYYKLTGFLEITCWRCQNKLLLYNDFLKLKEIRDSSSKDLIGSAQFHC